MADVVEVVPLQHAFLRKCFVILCIAGFTCATLLIFTLKWVGQSRLGSRVLCTRSSSYTPESARLITSFILSLTDPVDFLDFSIYLIYLIYLIHLLYANGGVFQQPWRWGALTTAVYCSLASDQFQLLHVLNDSKQVQFYDFPCWRKKCVHSANV